MKIHLFRAFPDSFRKSMLLYADLLEENLAGMLGSAESVRQVIPYPAWLRPSLMRHFSQYIAYQFQASVSQGDINHITDHAYGHLVHTMNARKTIVTFHDAIRFKQMNELRKKKSESESVKQMLNFNHGGIKKAAFVICDSESSRQDLIEITDYPRERTEVIPLGVDQSFFESEIADPREALDLKPGNYLLHVGHVGGYKNISALFHVLKILAEHGRSDIRLLKVGLDFSPEQKKMAKVLGVEKQICYRGRVSHEQLKRFYRAADVLLFPSFDEGFGFPVLEAMASSLPVVCSRRGSLPEILGDCGVLAEPGNYEAMADGVLKFLEDDFFRSRKTSKGVERARGYTWQATAEKTYAVYKKVHDDR